MNQVELSVVIPAFNEADNFNHGALDAVYQYLYDSHPHFELVLVDDGSQDLTLSLLNKFAKNKPQVKVIQTHHRGKGPTVIEGMLKASGKYRLFTDFDQSTPIKEVEKLLVKIKSGYEIAIGSREIMGSKREAEPWYRHLMGKGFNFGVKLLTVRGIQDTQCGFKLFTEAATQMIFPKIKATVAPKQDAFTGAMDVEILYIAQKCHLKIAEVPVFWHHVESKRVSPVKDSFRMAVDVLRIRLEDWRGGYAI
jgi:dolichyl-phosphate beta-glucosyltransferase